MAAQKNILQADLWFFNLDIGEESESLAFEILNEEEISRALRFIRPGDRRHFAVCRACVRAVLAHYAGGIEPSDVHFDYGKWGKPFFDGISFSIAHSHSFGLLAVAPSGPVGCDIEWHGRNGSPDALAEYFPLQERQELMMLSSPAKRKAFFTLWVRKEAVGKACGQGLGVGLDKIAASCRDDEPVVHVLPGSPAPAGKWWVPSFSFTDSYSAACALPIEHAGLPLVRRGPFSLPDVFSGKIFEATGSAKLKNEIFYF